MCGNPNVGVIKDGNQYFFKKHNNQRGIHCSGSFTQVK
jgi:hypothetical protein